MNTRTPIIHELKCWPQYFGDVLNGSKTFELRHDDRDFQVGDTLHLVEYDPVAGAALTGRVCDRQISYVMRDSAFLPGDYVCLGLWQPNDAVYESAIFAQETEISRLADMVKQRTKDAERYRAALQWYADGNHCVALPEWEEEEGWLCPPNDEPWMVEPGHVAHAVLVGRQMNPDTEADELTINATREPKQETK